MSFAFPSRDGLSIPDAVRQHATRAAPGHFDELFDTLTGGLRPAWQRFFGLMGHPTAGLDDLSRRGELLNRQLRDNGVTHNVYAADPRQGGAERPWQLGVLPLLIQPEDWRQIEAGVQQRARLLQAMAEDAYGPRHLLHEGLLPTALMLGHPGYLRALHGTRPPGGLYLHLCAFDVARGPDGQWWVLSQRTQAPSGLGYLLENRLTVSRLFPEAFRELRVQHLASGYRQLLDTLHDLAAPLAGGGAPRIALLTPGPYNETYFEHAYLARYLGLPLVEGADLVVRDDRVFLKTVQGLEPVHGLLRRLDDDWCDPLELRADSSLGVPGLLQAVRAGQVMVANALGTGFLESPGVQGFLPAIAQRLLGEPLHLPSLPTWWCGEAAAWQATRASLSERVVRATYPASAARGPTFLPAIGRDMPTDALARWADQIDGDPDAHTVQAQLAFSHAPLWLGNELVPRSSLLRVYAVADTAGGWHILPGGLTRVATADPHIVSMQHGGSSLDTWVMTDGPVDTFSLLRPHGSTETLALRQRPVASRTAENLYWMGRYTERTEHLVRLAQACEALVDDDDDIPDAVLLAMSDLAVSAGLAPVGVPTLLQAPRVFERAVTAAMVDQPGSQGACSIAWNLAALQRCAEALRDRLSPEHWRLVRTMSEDFELRMRWLRHAPPGGDGFAATELQAALEHLADQLAAVTGAQSDRMTRDHGWRLLTIGRLTERLVLMSDTLRAFCEAPAGRDAALRSVQGFDLALTLFDSTITFRARYQRREDLLALMDLLVLDESNPRALACVLRRLRTEIRKLPTNTQAGTTWQGVEPLLELLPQEGAGLTLDALLAAAQQGSAEVLALAEPLAHRLHAAGKQLSDGIGQRYFAHADSADRWVAS